MNIRILLLPVSFKYRGVVAGQNAVSVSPLLSQSLTQAARSSDVHEQLRRVFVPATAGVP